MFIFSCFGLSLSVGPGTINITYYTAWYIVSLIYCICFIHTQHRRGFTKIN